VPPLCKLVNVSVYHEDIYNVSCMRTENWCDALESAPPDYAILDSDDIVNCSVLWSSFLQAMHKASSALPESAQPCMPNLPAPKVRIPTCLGTDLLIVPTCLAHSFHGGLLI